MLSGGWVGGNIIRFWLDEWSCNGKLKDQFPHINAITKIKYLVVEVAYVGGGLGLVWNVEVMRNLNDWEVGKYEDLLQMLSDIRLNQNSDTLVWTPKQDGNYTVKSFYDVLMESNENEAAVFPYKQIWKAHAPPRVAFFAWEAGKEFLTIDRGRVMVNACYLCRRLKLAIIYCHDVLLLIIYGRWCMACWVFVGWRRVR